MIICTKTRSEIITLNKDILISKNKDDILDKIINHCGAFLLQSEDAIDFSYRKKALQAWIIGTQNAVNGNGLSEINFQDKKDYLKGLTISSVSSESFQNELEKLAVHRNAPFGNRKLNLFGNANFTTHMEKLMGEIDKMSYSEDKKLISIPLDDIKDKGNISY